VNNTEVIDTTFLTSIIYSKNGEKLGSIRLFGSNETGTPPTYSLLSSFEYENSGLIIYNNEYSAGKTYADIQLVEGSDSLEYADVTSTKFYLDYHTNEIRQIEQSFGKTQVAEPYRTSFLRPVD